MSSAFRPSSLVAPAIIVAMGTITVASAQSSSPFARKNKVQAWERPAQSVNPSSINSAPARSSGQPIQSAPPLRDFDYRPNNNPNINQPLNQSDGLSSRLSNQAAPLSPNNFTATSPSPQAPTSTASSAKPSNLKAAKSATGSDFYYPGRVNGGLSSAAPQNIQSQNLQSHTLQNQNLQNQTFQAQSPNSQISGSRTSGSQISSSDTSGFQGFGPSAFNRPSRQSLTQAKAGNVQGANNSAISKNDFNPDSFNQNSFNQAQFDPRNNIPNAQYNSPQYGGQNYGVLNTPTPKRSWKDRLGLGKLQTLLRGHAKVGQAAVDNANGDNEWDVEFIGDADIELELGAITQSGLEYGVVIGGRAQYDRFRRGFGQRLPDCPPSEAGCASAVIAGVETGLRGHTTQFYSDGADDARAGEIQLETGYAFLRSAYGDITLGRDDGAAYLFSLGAPSLLAVGASNSPVDYTGFDSVKTINEASGFSEKVTYTSPRLLGDTIGVGVQVGVSYARNARACGVDYCVRSNEDQGSGTVAADLDDVIEAGIAFDRRFDNGLRAELTASYARANEQSNLAGLDDLQSFNAGLELSYEDWVLGGSYLRSNNALSDGDYEAYDIGLTWKPSKLGFTLGYGHARDENVDLTSDQAVFGVTYDLSRFTIGAGVQYIDRTTPVFDGTTLSRVSEDATAIFVETGFTF